MYRLNLPPYPIKVVERDNKQLIFDFLRRKYVALTPEEWVRQHFVHFLIDHKGYPRLSCVWARSGCAATPYYIIRIHNPG